MYKNKPSAVRYTSILLSIATVLSIALLIFVIYSLNVGFFNKSAINKAYYDIPFMVITPIVLMALNFGVMHGKQWGRILAIALFASLIVGFTILVSSNFKTISSFLASPDIIGVPIVFMVLGRALFGLALHPDSRQYFNLNNSNKHIYSTLHTVSGTLLLSSVPIAFSLQSIVRNNYLPAFSYILINLFTYLLYWSDKDSATKGKWRVSERLMHFCEFWGGFPSAYLAQRTLRHKIVKSSYQGEFILIFVLHLCLVLTTMSSPNDLLRNFIVVLFVVSLFSRRLV
jgi:uncharacterized membrane protein YsdA (DUF1294 family)